MVEMSVVVERVWQRSRGKCECTRTGHSHPYICCNKPLVRDKHNKPFLGGWKFNYRLGYSEDAITSCEILCWDCYQRATKTL